MQEPLVHASLPEGNAADVDQPGLSALRDATVNRSRHFPEGATFRRDVVAALNSALSSVPDGMVCGLLAGVNPIHGLYACMAGPIAGGLLTSTQLMMITTTAAAALGAGQALYDVPFDLPIGGSLSTTALSIASGAASRRAAILSGMLMAVIVVVFPALTERVAMPALATLLIYASAKAIRYENVRAVRVAGLPSIVASVATFVATLMLPIQLAVGIGIVLSAVIHVYVSSADVHLVELIERDDGDVVEVPLDRRLRSNQVTVLDAYGSLFYAGARTLERQLPPPGDAHAPVVILRMRGRTSLGATLISVLSSYAEKLSVAGGRLYLSGLSPGALRELAHWQTLNLEGPVHAFEVKPVIGESTRAARADAEAWLLGVAKEHGQMRSMA